MNYFSRCTLAVLFFAATYCHANSIKAKISFIKKPPLGGILYIKEERSSPKNATIDQKGKAFTQKVIAGTPQGTAIFHNNDTHDHNIFVNDIEYGVSFDAGLIPSGGKSEVKIDWKSNSLVRLGCKIHPKMRAYLANVNSDYFTVMEFEKTTQTYDIELDASGAKSNVVVLQFPKYEIIEVELTPNSNKKIDIIRKGKTKGSVTLERN